MNLRMISGKLRFFCLSASFNDFIDGRTYMYTAKKMENSRMLSVDLLVLMEDRIVCYGRKSF